MTKQGTLCGVGLGPGDPGLVTIKAAQCLSTAKVIAYPMALGKTSFARRIAAGFIQADITEIQIDLITGTAPQHATATTAIYDQAAQTITKVLQNGQDVLFLCAGDPFLYGSFMYIHERVYPTFNVSVIPGVSSIMAAAAEAHMPLAQHNQSVHILPATLGAQALTKRISHSDTCVLVKAGAHIQTIKHLFATTWASTHKAMYISGASWDNAVVCPLSQAPSTAPYFSLVIITKITAPAQR